MPHSEPKTGEVDHRRSKNTLWARQQGRCILWSQAEADENAPEGIQNALAEAAENASPMASRTTPLSIYMAALCYGECISMTGGYGN